MPTGVFGNEIIQYLFLKTRGEIKDNVANAQLLCYEPCLFDGLIGMGAWAKNHGETDDLVSLREQVRGGYSTVNAS